MTKIKEPLSTCCNAPLMIIRRKYYVCSKCGKLCTAVARVKDQEEEGKKEPYKRECNHGKELHWKECPECREYMVRKEYETPKLEEIRQSPMSKEDIADMVKIAKMNQPEETEEWKENFEDIAKYIFYLKDPTYGEENRRNKEQIKQFIESLLSQKDKEVEEKQKELKENILNALVDIEIVEQDGHPFCFKRSRCEWNRALTAAKKEIKALLKPTK